MDAGKKILLDLFTGSLRFVVPVYQRRYSWGEAQCRQLWADIVTAGRHPERTHFTGSIVWMQEGGIGPDGVSRCQLIDGQQRLTSVTLLSSHWPNMPANTLRACDSPQTCSSTVGILSISTQPAKAGTS